MTAKPQQNHFIHVIAKNFASFIVHFDVVFLLKLYDSSSNPEKKERMRLSMRSTN